MTDTGKGWILGLAAFGMMLGLLAVEIASLEAWEPIVTPKFVGTTMGHVASVIAAFIGGRLIPADK